MFGQSYIEKVRTADIGLPQWGLTCFYDSSVLNLSAVLRLNFSANKPPLRQAEKRYYFTTTTCPFSFKRLILMESTQLLPVL